MQNFLTDVIAHTIAQLALEKLGDHINREGIGEAEENIRGGMQKIQEANSKLFALGQHAYDAGYVDAANQIAHLHNEFTNAVKQVIEGYDYLNSIGKKLSNAMEEAEQAEHDGDNS